MATPEAENLADRALLLSVLDYVWQIMMRVGYAHPEAQEALLPAITRARETLCKIAPWEDSKCDCCGRLVEVSKYCRFCDNDE